MAPAKAFLVICLNPVLQETHLVEDLQPGRIHHPTLSLHDIAGKGVNTTRIIGQLGEPAVHLTQLGEKNRDRFLSLSAADGLDVRWVPAPGEIRFCHTLISRADNTVTELVEAGTEVTPEVEAGIADEYAVLVEGAHTVVIAGSKAPGFSREVFPAMVRRARAAGARVLVDIRKQDLLDCLHEGIDVIKVNVSEFSQTFLPDRPLPENVDPADIPPALLDRARALESEIGARVVLTNGAKPVIFFEDGELKALEPERVIPENTIGCGDAVSAGIAVGLWRGAPLRDAVALGLEAARRNALNIRPGRID